MSEKLRSTRCSFGVSQESQELQLEKGISPFWCLDPVMTLHDHLRGPLSKPDKGRPSILSREEEREIALTCISLQELGLASQRML